MKVLVTGSSGYIGKNLINYFKSKKIKIVQFDLVDGYDILKVKDLQKKLKEVDYIVHLAAIADVYEAAKDPITTLRIGVEGTTNLILAANKFFIKKLIYISTWEVYGEPRYQPVDEKHECNPDHPYSIAKYSGELMVRSYTNKTPWLILRLGTVYGSIMRPTSVISRFISKSLKNEPIIIHGSGNQGRQFTHIDDICQAILLALKSDRKNSIFNITDDKVITIKQLAFLIKKITLSDSRIMFGKSREGDVIPSIISNKKAKKGLNWKPKVKIQAALNSMLKALSKFS